jgi:hypothetical protein
VNDHIVLFFIIFPTRYEVRVMINDYCMHDFFGRGGHRGGGD